MRTSRANLYAFSLLLCLGLFGQPVQAQADGYLSSNNLHGIVSGNTYQFGSIDNINLGTGAINIRIPLLSVKGRGTTDEYVYSYSSKIWVASPIWDPVNPNLLDDLVWAPSTQPNAVIGKNPGGQVLYTEQNYQCEWNNKPLGQNVDTNFTYITNDGATYEFPNRHIWNSDGSSPNAEFCPGVKETQFNVMQSNEGVLQLDTTNFPNTFPPTTDPIVTTKNGFRILPNPLCSIICLPISVEDTNGNLENVNGDTLLRTMSFPIKDSNGIGETYTAHTSSGKVTTAFPSTSCGTAPVIQPANQDVYQASSLTLPNNWTYAFTYDPQFGDITKVMLPSGGYIRYDYTILPQVDSGPANQHCYLDSRRIAHRYVSPDGNPQHEQTWTYVWTTGNFPTTTVTDPLGNVTVHSFTITGNPNAGGRIPHETATQYQQNGTIIKTVSNTWVGDSCGVQSQQNSNSLINDGVNYRITDTTTTLNDSTQVTDLQTDYDSYQPLTGYCLSSTESRMNPTELREYDFGSGSKGPLLRKTDYTYLHNNNSNYLNAHIWDRPASKSIYDGSSNLYAQSTYEYDNYTLSLTASGAVQHDAAYNASANYTIRGNLTATSRWRNTDGALLTTRNQYDDAGNVRSTTDPKGNVTSFSYTDSWGNTTCVPTGGNAAAYSTSTTDPLTHIFKATYNSCSGTVASAIDVNNNPTTVTYDGMGRPTLVKYPDLGQTGYSYVDIAPLSASSTSPLTLTPPPPSLVNTILLDGLGRVAQTQLNSDPIGADYTATTYDALGRAYQVYNPTRCNPPTTYCGESTWGYTTYGYDVLGRTKQVTQPDGSIITTSYFGNCTTVTDEAAKDRKSCSDGLGRLTSVFENPSSLNYETDYSYDALDNLLCAAQKGTNSGTFSGCPSTPASWRPRSFNYDSLSHLTSSTNPESGTITYTYDNNGNVLTKKDARSTQTTYSYDALNRVTNKTYSDSTPAATFVYDLPSDGTWTMSNPVGRLVVAYAPTSSDDASEVFSYDKMGRVILHAQAGALDYGKSGNSSAYNVNYTYDLAGNLTKEAMSGWEFPSSGVTLSYAYNSASQTTSVTSNLVDPQHPSPLATPDPSVGYYPTGALRKVLYGNGLTGATAFNKDLQPCRINLNSSAATLSTCTDPIPSGNLLDHNYGFNAGTSDNGNLASWTATGQKAFNRTYTYDMLNRLFTMSDSNSGQQCRGLSWNDDAWGNRTDQTNTAGTCPTFHQTVNTQNRLVGLPYLYDAAGNLTADGTHTYSYDAENRITQVDSGTTASYVYSVEGRRVTKISGGSTRDYVYDLSNNVIAEMTSSGWQVGNVYLGGQMIAEYKNSTTYFVHQDHLGSTRLVTGLNQAPVQNLDYFPYGEPNSTDSGITTHEFTGKERDGTAQTETGLDNFGARYNSSSMGRFMSPDPGNIGVNRLSPQTWNAYSYSLNNPLVLTDPTGLYVCEDSEQCDSANDKAFAKSLADAQAAANNLAGDDRAAAQRAIDAYGAQGDDNGVNVRFDSKIDGAVTEVSGVANGNKSADLNPNGQNINVTFNPNDIGGDSVAHEGSHVADGSAWVASGFTANKNPTNFTTEFNAYHVQFNILNALGVIQAPPGMKSAGASIPFSNPLSWRAGDTFKKVSPDLKQRIKQDYENLNSPAFRKGSVLEP